MSHQKKRAGQDLAALERRNRRQAQRATKTGKRSRRYRDYLASPRWQALRRRLLTPTARCAECGKDRSQLLVPLDLHHLTYDRLGCERDEDLVILCRVHHNRIHAKRNQQRAWIGARVQEHRTWNAARQGDQSHRDRQLASTKAARKASASPARTGGTDPSAASRN